MKYRPILFSAPMVRALLNGTKTQTRRVVKPRIIPNGHWMAQTRGGKHELTHWDNDATETTDLVCPYGQPGDRLWVRETFQPTLSQGVERGDTDWETGHGYQLRYTATDERVEWVDGDDKITSRCKPAIHMPRWASRITLEITAVRVELLQDISEADAAAEGWIRRPEVSTDPLVHKEAARDWYMDLWEAINGAASWDLNPWVWVIEFTRMEGGAA